MKRKFVLLPITLTALAPTIGIVGCGDPDKPTPPEPENHYQWSINSGRFTYELISDIVGGDFKIKLKLIKIMQLICSIQNTRLVRLYMILNYTAEY